MLLTYFSAAYRIYIKFLALQAALKFIVKHVHMSLRLYVCMCECCVVRYENICLNILTGQQSGNIRELTQIILCILMHRHINTQTYLYTYIHTYINEYLNKYLLMLMGMNANKCATHIAHIVVIAVHFLSRQFFKIKIIRIFQ